MKVIFLDIDGVLNGAFSPKMKGKLTLGIDPTRLRHLHCLLDEVADVKIVISSTWKLSYERDEIATFLKLKKDQFHESWRTPNSMSGNRLQEIRFWAEDNYTAGILRGVVLDDDRVGVVKKDVGFPILEVNTDTYVGLSMYETVVAKNFLNGVTVTKDDRDWHFVNMYKKLKRMGRIKNDTYKHNSPPRAYQIASHGGGKRTSACVFLCSKVRGQRFDTV